MGKHLLFDTNVIIDAARGNKQASKVLDKSDAVRVSIITLFELYDGCRNLNEVASIDEFVESCEVAPLNDQISKVALDIFKNEKLAKGIGIGDSLIAATAVVGDFTLITLNLKHFDFITGLRVLKPY